MRALFGLRRRTPRAPGLILALAVAATVLVSLIVGAGASLSKSLGYHTTAAPATPVPLAGLLGGPSLRDPPQAGVPSAPLFSWLAVRQHAALATTSRAGAAPAHCCSRSMTSRNNPERNLRLFLLDMATLQRDRARELLPGDRALSDHPSAALAEAATTDGPR